MRTTSTPGREVVNEASQAAGRLLPWLVLVLVLVLVLAACGGRTPISRGQLVDAGDGPSAERCNGLDDDRDGKIDEIFRDPDGRYLHDEHCGACGRTCEGIRHANAESQGCGLLGDMPACVALTCAPGFGLSKSGSCVQLDAQLCLPCQTPSDCGPLATAACLDIGGENRCTRPCLDGCPSGYECAGDHCEPLGHSCNCSGTDSSFDVACRPPGASGVCTGRARCENGALSECAAPAERCDGTDDDCDGAIDEDFVDERGAYSLDQANCGACGIDCRVDTKITGLGPIQLTCGGDPFAPTCVTRCPDARDGIQPGDRLDADRQLENGCECTVRTLADTAGAPAAEGQVDGNCDGADGEVLSSIYVSVDGDDSGPGSPTRPLRSIDAAIMRASASLDTSQPRPHVYVAAGVYTESVRMRDGVRLHGGYRSDFLAQSADNFEVIVVAPADTDAPFGAALVAEHAGNLPTLIEGIRFRGRDALASGEAAIGAVLDDPGGKLVLRALSISSGRPGNGAAGGEGEAGETPSTEAAPGDPPRGAVETFDHVCGSAGNVVRGGAGGRSICGGSRDVSGGSGGAAVCPSYAELANSGNAGRSADGAIGGDGGGGGQDVRGPIVASASCPNAVCCGLADFEVAGELAYPQAGAPGGDGRNGSPGGACTDPFGFFVNGAWTPGQASPGASGGPGGGGGGGGAGGGAEIEWMASVCEFADGIGGGGGGGGGGGCGGSGGGAGQHGGLAIGLLVRGRRGGALPTFQDVVFDPQDGGNGGDGGAGGDGGLGGSGGFGGDVDDARRSTPTLAGVMAGQRGGKGGNGGAGGGGGGGCGGSSVGLWVTGLTLDSTLSARLLAENDFEIGAPGRGGRGGGGPLPAADGADGGTANVLLR